MRIRELKLFGCKLTSLDVVGRQPNNRSQVALESEDLRFDPFPAATLAHNRRLAP
jgi:hypothetical protein